MVCVLITVVPDHQTECHSTSAAASVLRPAYFRTRWLVINYPNEGIRADIVIGLACFFTFMTVTEGGGRRAVARKFQDVYLPALKANFMLWPMVQILNFRVIPLQFQIVSTGTILPMTGLTKHPAVCFDRWYCVDSISLTDQFR